MMFKQWLGFALIASLSATAQANSTAEKWASVKTRSQQTMESIGSYTAGCISGAAELPVNGVGYQVMRLSRQRFYGHSQLIQFIEHLGQTAASDKLGTLLIGDLGQPRGGPTLTGHRSHQTGLDVDIWFLLLPTTTHLLSAQERESLSAPSVLFNGTIDKHQWQTAHEKILQNAALSPEVDRIFVNPNIKRELCHRYAEQTWLRKIRPWWKHDDHFHVRLKCPTGNIHCQAQEPLPQGDGCGKDLAWWFSAEALHPAPKKPQPSAESVLPALCQKVLTQ